MLTIAGRDHQVRVLADPNSSGVGLYAPAIWVGVSENGTTPSGSETTLAGEITDGSLARAEGTLIYTTGSISYVIARTLVSDRNVTLRKAAIFTAQSGGTMMYVDLMNQPVTMVSGDQLNFAMTINLNAVTS